MAKIFIVGATGHIGGAVVDLVSKYPENQHVTVLVRDQAKSAQIAALYPHITTAIGNLDTLDILESNSKLSNVVINTGPDVTHASGIRAILKGLAARSEKGYYIHTSGAALIWDAPDGSKPGAKVWDDIADIHQITSMPDGSTHSAEDKIVFSASPNVNVAIVSPTMVYGLSPSPVHPYPLTIPEILNGIRAISSGFTISSGQNLQGYVHVKDLAGIYHLLAQHALNPTLDKPANLEVWGPNAYYFGEQQELPFIDYMKLLVRPLKNHGVLTTNEIKQIDITTAAKATGAADGIPVPDSWAMHIAIMFGVNMRVRSSRAKALGWKPQEGGVGATLDEVIEGYLEAQK